MLNNQDFAQSERISPAKTRLKLVSYSSAKTRESSKAPNLNQDAKLLQETIVKIEGAYAPSTIRAYRADFSDFICFCHNKDENALPAQQHFVTQYIAELTDSGSSSASIRKALCGLSAIHRLNRFEDPTKIPMSLLKCVECIVN